MSRKFRLGTSEPVLRFQVYLDASPTRSRVFWGLVGVAIFSVCFVVEMNVND